MHIFNKNILYYNLKLYILLLVTVLTDSTENGNVTKDAYKINWSYSKPFSKVKLVTMPKIYNKGITTYFYLN